MMSLCSLKIEILRIELKCKVIRALGPKRSISYHYENMKRLVIVTVVYRLFCCKQKFIFNHLPIGRDSIQQKWGTQTLQPCFLEPLLFVSTNPYCDLFNSQLHVECSSVKEKEKRKSYV